MAIPQFIESPRFELLPGWEFQILPQYVVDIVEQGRNGELANLFTRYPKFSFEVSIPPDKQADIPLIIRWYHIARSRAVAFRVRDPSDYLSTQQGFYVDDSNTPAPAFTDQPLVQIPETNTYQLFKQYRLIYDETAEWIQERPIRKPVPGSIIVGNDSGVLQPPERWTLDTTTGILTPLGEFIGTPATWGGEFDVPVRFDSDLPIRMADMQLKGLNFSLKEKPYASAV